MLYAKINYMKLKYITKDTLHPELENANPLVQKLINPIVDSNQSLEELKNTPHKRCEDIVLRQAVAFMQDISAKSLKTMIVGDYDCDGICSTTMLVRLCEKLQIDYGYYIPNRVEEGYGLQPKLVQDIAEKDYQALITVDNGVKAQPALELAQRLGLRVMIVDHHQIQQEVLCDVLYHTDLLGTWFQNQCASGLLATLMDAMDLLDDYDLALAAIGTIGDMMHLSQHNRYLVQAGIKQLNKHRYPAIDFLLKRAVKAYDASVVSFNIVPVLNAVGRLNDPAVKIYQMVAYLVHPDQKGLKENSKIIKSINEKRKQLTQEHLKQAEQLVVDHQNIQILVKNGFHEGIIGIVAGHLANRLQVPVMVGTENQGLYKFSVRSPFLDIYSVLETYSGRYFEAFGGHEKACAFSIKPENFEAFKAESLAHFQTIEISEPVQEVILLETEDLKLEYFNQLLQYEPFGQGFQRIPVVIEGHLLKGFPIKDIGRKWTLQDNQDLVEVVTFGVDKDLDISHASAQIVGELQKTYNQQKLSLLASKILI